MANASDHEGPIVNTTSERAVHVIGEQQDGDYILSPVAHAELYEEGAPRLSEALSGSALQTIAVQFERLDREAGSAQASYKSTMNRANVAVLVAAVLGAFMMAAEILSAKYAALHLGVPSLGVGAAIASALGAMWIYRARQGRLLEAWMSQRAAAETARLEYFAALTRLREDAEPDPELLALKLEYFRRYQLEMQIQYYAARRRDHRRSAERSARLGGIAVALAALATGVGGIIGASDGSWSALGVLGVMGAALGAYAGAREAMNQDRRNAERYGRTLVALEKLKARIGDVRKAAAAGNASAVEEYVAAVNDQISLEHRQWLEGGEGARDALARLEKALAAPDQSKNRRGK